MTTTSGGSDDHRWMKLAIELSRQCPPSSTAYSVGAVIVDANGNELSRGYSREKPKVHAEEAALAKLPNAASQLQGSTIYSTLEPCTQRTSSPKPCTQLILEAGVRRVVVAWREPSLFVDNCVGLERLEDAGVIVIEMSELADEARQANAHLRL